jgi:hypothetical protein
MSGSSTRWLWTLTGAAINPVTLYRACACTCVWTDRPAGTQTGSRSDLETRTTTIGG